jgi:hypothetical protein
MLSEHSSDSEEAEKIKNYNPFEIIDNDIENSLVKGKTYYMIFADKEALADVQKGLRQLYKTRLKSRQKARERRTKERIEKGKTAKNDNYDLPEHFATLMIAYKDIPTSECNCVYEGKRNGMTMGNIAKFAGTFNAKHKTGSKKKMTESDSE